MMSIYKKTRRFLLVSLVFSFIIISCSSPGKNNNITLRWEQGKAVGVAIPVSLLKGMDKELVEISLVKETKQPAIPGDYSIENDTLVFRPIIPFTRGLTYRIAVAGNVLAEIKLLPVDPSDAPTVLTVYPSPDTLPENLLKIHILFSQPMQEGESFRHIAVVKNGKDTIPVFLDLEPELWNHEHTMLTCWLDPGRIKRDLQPNKNMGQPLYKGEHYELIIKPGWQDTKGGTLLHDYSKKFFAATRDSISPDPLQWTVHPPKVGTTDGVIINMHESLDQVLLMNAINIKDATGKSVTGVFRVAVKETILSFMPDQPWRAGRYRIDAEERLEDLAGNNLTRLFDNDLEHSAPKNKTGDAGLTFVVQ